jgi:hypothetical protein
LSNEKTGREQAKEALVKMIDDSETKIKGVVYNQEANDRYEKIKFLCEYRLVKPPNADIRIEADEVTNDKEHHRIIVYSDILEISSENKETFFEIIKLADDTIIYGDESNYFHISFYVNDIWTE